MKFIKVNKEFIVENKIHKLYGLQVFNNELNKTGRLSVDTNFTWKFINRNHKDEIKYKNCIDIAWLWFQFMYGERKENSSVENNR